MKRSYEPDPKPRPTQRRPARTVDPTATRAAVLRERGCVVCGRPAATGHHVLPRGRGGDDVAENLVALCGSGTTGCHGDIENRDPAASRALGDYLVAERRDVVAYLRRKLGIRPARAFLYRRYHVEVR